jgi:hypothetical protein
MFIQVLVWKFRTAAVFAADGASYAAPEPIGVFQGEVLAKGHIRASRLVAAGAATTGGAVVVVVGRTAVVLVDGDVTGATTAVVGAGSAAGLAASAAPS